MKRKWMQIGIILLFFFLLISCGRPTATTNLHKVAMLVPNTVDDQVWSSEGYKGLLKIQSQFHVDVFYKEGIHSKTDIEKAINEFSEEGVNLIIGHGKEYAHHFNQIAKKYPNIHFVSFNGNAIHENTTSIIFKGYAMGFFGGMVAGHHTTTDHVGVIAAFEWQPEVQGFYDGATYENQDIEVHIQYVNDFDNTKKALEVFEQMVEHDIDVFYPAGDTYNVSVIEKVKEKSLFAIGYVSEQSDLGESTVLTSTIQRVDILYERIAEQFNKGKLESGNKYVDFQDGVIDLGELSPLLDEEFTTRLQSLVERYKKTGMLPD